MMLSVLIPARNEIFLARTIEDLIEHSEAETEIIAVFDGLLADPPVAQHPMVNVISLSASIGQRAATNLAAKLARGKYVAKVDAHCSFDQGWDRKMIEFFKENGDDITAVPVMRNLWAFDWKCYHCGWKMYQGPTPESCGWVRTKEGELKKIGEGCGKTDRIKRKMMWVGKERPTSVSYCFDTEPHFKYFEEYKHREPYLTDKATKKCTESMSLQGSFFMATRENYWKWELSDERLGNWGNQGIELACATWLSGGRVLVNHNTWYAHMFRTQGGDFGFPWDNKGMETSKTKNNVWQKFLQKKHPTQKYPISWLLERFWPVTGWTTVDLTKLKESEVV